MNFPGHQILKRKHTSQLELEKAKREAQELLKEGDVNKIMEEIYNHDLKAVGGKLKELLGHTPLEVYVGAAYGILFAYAFHLYVLG